MAETDVIRAPDQRLRVFVSSTLQELAAERQAVRDAVTRLRHTLGTHQVAHRRGVVVAANNRRAGTGTAPASDASLRLGRVGGAGFRAGG